MVRRGREEAAKGRQIVIFPEGTRRPPGAARLPARHRAPLQGPRPAGRAGRPQLRPLLAAPEFPEVSRHDRHRVPAADRSRARFADLPRRGSKRRSRPPPTGCSPRPRLARRRHRCRPGRRHGSPRSARPSPLRDSLRARSEPAASSASATFSRIGSRNPRLRKMAHRIDDIVGVRAGAAVAVAHMAEDRLRREPARHIARGSRSTT